MKRHFNYCVAILILCIGFLNAVHAQQAIWGNSPKELFEKIGNPQVDLSDQSPAYENLKGKASYISGPQAKVNIDAAYYLAECYVSGKTGDGGPLYARNKKGFPPNRPEAYKLAIPFYESAAQYDHIPSLVRLSLIYADDNYKLKDLNISLTYLVKAAKLGDKPSLEKLSQLYSSGFAGVTDENLKSTSIEVLASLGNAEAQLVISKKAAAAEAIQKQQDEARQAVAAQTAAANEALQKQQTEARRAAAAQKAAAEEAFQKQQAEAQQVAAAQKAEAADALQKHKDEARQAVAARAAQKEAAYQKASTIIITCIVFFGIILIVAIIGTYLGIKDKVIIFWGKRDVVVSFIISIILLFCFVGIIMMQGEDEDGKLGLLKTIGVIFAVSLPLLIYSIRRSYIANSRNFNKTLLVMPTKLAVSGLTAITGYLSYLSARSALESTAKASSTPGYTEELRKEKLRHKKEAISNASNAAVLGYVTYHLHNLIKKLIKENPAQTSKEPTE